MLSSSSTPSVAGLWTRRQRRPVNLRALRVSYREAAGSVAGNRDPLRDVGAGCANPMLKPAIVADVLTGQV